MKLMDQIKKYRVVTFMFIFLFTSFLTACGIGVAETEITVFNNKYKLSTIINVSYDQMQMIGSPKVFEEALDEVVLEASNEGLKISWRDITQKDGSTYRYEVSTDMIDITDPSVDNFSWEETRYNNRTAYEFRYSQFAGILSGFQSHTITLHAGKILDSNGTRLDDSTVTWVNPSVTPYAIVIPKNSLSWVFIILAAAIVAVIGFFLFKLIKSGKLTEWATAGFNVGKWKIQETKLNSEIKSLEQDKEILISQLGEKTWNARVKDSAYSEQYEQLEMIDQQVSEVDNEVKVLDSNLQDTRNTHSRLKTEYSEMISHLKNEHKTADENLSTYRKNQDNLEKQVSKLDKEKDKLEDEIQDYEKKLVQIQESNDEDKEEKAVTLNSAISTVNKKLLEINHQIPEIQSEISKLQMEQQPLIDKITDINEQITKTQADQKESLDPLEQQISELEGKIKEKKTTINDLQQQMKPVINKLGPTVNSARPESETLRPLYDRIDRKNSELTAKSEDHNLLRARLDASDKSALRNLLLTIAGIIIATILIVVFLSAAF
jgi:predicted  nucleic acid-binding Zn-ribbon protein